MRKTALPTLLAAGIAAAAFTTSTQAFAYGAGDFFTRVGVAKVEPKSDNGSLADGAFDVDVQDDSAFAFTLGYRFTDKLGVELLAAEPFDHDVYLNDANLASTDHLPPTFSLQYHFLPDGAFQPYVGLGLNATIFFSEDVDQALIDTVEALNPGLDVTGADLDLDTSFGIAAQVGADYILNENWTINFDVRWINIETDAELTVDPVGTLDLGTVEIDPWVYGINVGYKF